MGGGWTLRAAGAFREPAAHKRLQPPRQEQPVVAGDADGAASAGSSQHQRQRQLALAAALGGMCQPVADAGDSVTTSQQQCHCLDQEVFTGSCSRSDGRMTEPAALYSCPTRRSPAQKCSTGSAASATYSQSPLLCAHVLQDAAQSRRVPHVQPPVPSTPHTVGLYQCLLRRLAMYASYLDMQHLEAA